MIPFRPRRSLRPVRPRLPRRAIPWYLGALSLALLTGLLVTGALRRAAQAEAAYGTTRPVAVVAHPVPAGATITADDVEVRPWPTALVPPDAAVDGVAGRTALVSLVPGEVVIESRLADPGVDGPVAMLAPDQRAVPVPVVVPGLELRVGDRVDVLAGGGGIGPAGDLPGPAGHPDVVVAAATVLALAEETVVVAVPAEDAATVAAALTTGPLLLALRPPG